MELLPNIYMNETELTTLLDSLDRELDSYPFWAKFKKYAVENPIRGVDKLTPGRQVLLIFWKATFENNRQDADFAEMITTGNNISERIDRLKSNLVGNFSNDKLNDEYMGKFFRIMSNKLSSR